MLEIRYLPIPKDVLVFSIFDNDSPLKRHPDYRKAKAGDFRAALNLISDLVWLEINQYKDRFAKDCIFVAPFARESTGDNYVLLDDEISFGGTLAELAHYIQIKGGVVRDIAAIVNAGRNKSLSPDIKTLRILNERFGNEIIEIFGIDINALTANEAQYLVGFRSTDEIRNRLIKAKKESNLRLRSKGISGPFRSEDG